MAYTETGSSGGEFLGHRAIEFFRVQCSVFTDGKAEQQIEYPARRMTKLAIALGQRMDGGRGWLADLRADEVFLTGTAAEVTPVCEIDGVKYVTGQGTFSAAFRNAYLRAATGKDPRFAEWTTIV